MANKKGPPKQTLAWPPDRKPGVSSEMKWREFADEYIKDFNATAAYLRCSWTRIKKITAANNCGARLLATTPVQGYIREAIEARKKRTELDQDTVVLEQARIGLSNISEYVQWDDKGIHITPSANLSEDALRALEMIEIQERTNDDGTKLRRIRFKMHPKAPALESLAKHFGMYTGKLEIDHKFGVIKVPFRLDPDDWEEAISREIEVDGNGSRNGNSNT